MRRRGWGGRAGGGALLDQEAETKRQMGKADGDMAMARNPCEPAQAGLPVYA